MLRMFGCFRPLRIDRFSNSSLWSDESASSFLTSLLVVSPSKSISNRRPAAAYPLTENRVTPLVFGVDGNLINCPERTTPDPCILGKWEDGPAIKLPVKQAPRKLRP